MQKILSLIGVLLFSVGLMAHAQEWQVVAENNFGLEGEQAQLTAGSPFVFKGSDIPLEMRSVAFDSSQVQIDFRGLVPDASYRLQLFFYSDAERVQSVFVNYKPIEEDIVLSTTTVLEKTYDLDAAVSAAGFIKLEIRNKKGANAVISKAVLYSTNPKKIVPQTLDELRAETLARKKAALAERPVLPHQVEFPVFRPMDPKNVVLLDGEWAVEAGEQKGKFHVPGQLVQQGYAIGEEETAVFTRAFKLPRGFNNKQIFLRLDAMHGNAVYTLNGKEIGSSERLFTPIEFDVTDCAKSGNNLLEIRSQLKSDSEMLSHTSEYAKHSLQGIPRSVRVFALPEQHLEDCFVQTDLDQNYKNANFKLMLRANKPLVVNVKLDGVFEKKLSLQAGENEFNFPVEDPKKWTAETPNLYALHLDVNGEYSVTRQVGFREIEVVGKEIRVNGQMVKLHGVCRHEIDPLSGRADTAKWAETDAALFKQANVNYVRASHYPPTREFLEACDHIGLYVQDEAPFCWMRDRLGRTEDKYVNPLVDASLAMVSYDRNHPSVIGWSLANESGAHKKVDETPIANVFITQYHAIKQADPTRFTVFNHEKAYDSGLCEAAVFHYADADRAMAGDTTGRPILIDEAWHVVAYQPDHQSKDPGLLDEWGFTQGPTLWNSYLATDRIQGAAIWGAIDEVFEMPDGSLAGYGPWGSICDGYRRIKPEFFHVQMAFSPVQVLENTLEDLAEGSTQIPVELENRYSFTNLKELSADWSYGGQSGTVALPDIAPWTKGTLHLEVPPTQNGEMCLLTIKGKAGEDIAFWGVQTGKRPVVAADAPSAGATASLINQEIFVQSDDWSFTLDSDSGEIYDAKGDIFVPTRLPNPFIIQPEKGFVGRKSQYYGDLPDLMEREIDSVDIGEAAGVLTLTVKEYYGILEGTLVWSIGQNGVSSFDYDYEILDNAFLVKEGRRKKKVPLKAIGENGLTFPLPESCDELEWVKDTVWGYAPDWHIGRPFGRTKALYEGKASETERPWEMQETENGTADFRATKFDVYEVSLTDSKGRGIRYSGPGDACARAAVTETGTELRLFKRDPVDNRIKGSYTVR